MLKGSGIGRETDREGHETEEILGSKNYGIVSKSEGKDIGKEKQMRWNRCRRRDTTIYDKYE